MRNDHSIRLSIAFEEPEYSVAQNLVITCEVYELSKCVEHYVRKVYGNEVDYNFDWKERPSGYYE